MSDFGLYIHWPYCLSKCPYCDFASTRIHGDIELLKAGYIRDIENAPRGNLVSIYFGGGTPSLMSPELLDFLINRIHKKWNVDKNAEITMEANPDAIDLEKMKIFKNMGINRLSVGVQSLRPVHLKFLGRRHSVQTAVQCVENAQNIFPRVNMDLMYALPRQSLKDWEKELQEALKLGLTHYSLYQLTIEEGTVFYHNHQKNCSDIQARRLYTLTDEIMNRAKTPAYEVSNYAYPGFESRHNMLYWTGKDYIGIGPSACGRVLGHATQNARSVGEWLRQETTKEKLTPEQIQMEHLLMGLRLRRQFYFTDNINPQAIHQAKQKGWLIQSNQGIRPTLQGTLMLNQLIQMLA